MKPLDGKLPMATLSTEPAFNGKLPMATLNTEPAFPVNGATSWYPGMTLRDYFAAQALPILIKYSMENDDWELWQKWAEEAYKVADAMIFAREEHISEY